jgi:hypothetical protein
MLVPFFIEGNRRFILLGSALSFGKYWFGKSLWDYVGLLKVFRGLILPLNKCFGDGPINLYSFLLKGEVDGEVERILGINVYGNLFAFYLFIILEVIKSSFYLSS